MSEVKQEYLKDSKGNIISPVVSADSVYMGGALLTDQILKYRILYDTTELIPSITSGTVTEFTLGDDIKNYDMLIFFLDSFQVAIKFTSRLESATFRVDSYPSSNWMTEKINFICFDFEWNGKIAKVRNAELLKIQKDLTIVRFEGYESHLYKIVGLKF